MKYLYRTFFVAIYILCGRIAVAQEFPNFDIKSMDYNCPASFLEESYNTDFLRTLKFLALGSDGWIFRSRSDLTSTFGPVDESLVSLATFIKRLEARGTQLVILYVPTRGLMHHDRLLGSYGDGYNFPAALASYKQAIERIRAQGAIVPNLYELITPENSKDFFFKTDTHWTSNGARAAAKNVAEYIKHQPIYPQLDKKDFVNTPQGVYAPGSGILQTAWKTLCHQQFRKEFVKKYVHEVASTTAGGSGGSDSLFGDQADPQVVMVGSSFSQNPNLNFVGFLREYMHVDIDNVSASGGGFDGAITQFLSSDQFKKAPPKLLIWEVQSYFDLNHKPFYREVLPLVDDGCNSRKVVLSDEVTLHTGKNEFLFNGGGADSEHVTEFLNKDYIMDLQFSNPAFKKVHVTVWEMNGRKDSMNLKRTRNVSTAGRFVFELQTGPYWDDFVYLSSEVDVPEEFNNISVKARLCHK